ncbi:MULTISPECIES: glycosyltransferase [Clostridia]|uniref:glycosyltransferase n=1 Tax=Clostridia TaxID=186801 RepID=UPI000EA010AB|nr:MULTISPECIES: glycosyltransferase [Clostridia]NBJ70849.1 glycosyltransferase [Roseburia sp. 1XD42-34]RKI75710.1 glycosyltransferase [Clostridium sp. 1xD42-85]
MRAKENNIVIITPFYPINHRNDIYEDTKAVYYLISELSKYNNILILHMYMHGFKKAWRYLFDILPIKSDYKKYLYKDNYGNSLLFFQYLLLLPKKIRTLKYFSSRYSMVFSNFCYMQNYDPQIGIVHFPTYYMDFLKRDRMITKKIAIIHSFDIKNIKNRYSFEYWRDFFDEFNAIGFRSYVIKRDFEKILTLSVPTFMCLSGIPEKYANLHLKEKDWNKQELRFLYAGRLDANKNVINSIKALSKLSKDNYTFTVVGEGSEKEKLVKEAEKCGNISNINFTGKMTRDGTFEEMKKADIFIMVSKKETLGLVYLEAMAAGNIVIGSKGQGIDGIIINGVNGFLAEAENIDSIYNAVKKILALNNYELNEVRKNAKKTVELLTDNRASQNYLENIYSIL